MEITQTAADQRAIAGKIRELMDKSGVPAHEHPAEIRKHLNLSAAEADRKLDGESPWSLAQIREIASVFGVEPSALLEEPDAPEGIRHVVEKIEIGGGQASLHRPVIAVLDDNQDSANELARALQKRNFSAVPFHASRDLLAAMNQTDFSGFVIDWLLGHETAKQCIEEIRLTRSVAAPIVILTAYMGTHEHADSIVEMMSLFKIEGPFEKPARPGIIAAALEAGRQGVGTSED